MFEYIYAKVERLSALHFKRGILWKELQIQVNYGIIKNIKK